MAEIAVLDRPCDVAVVASPTIFTIDNFQHVDLVAPGFELEAQVAVAHLATEADAVKPVREDHRTHACFVGELVDYDISILRVRGLVIAEREHRCQECDGHP